MVGFARALRAAGVAVTADRERSYLQAAAEVGAGDAAGVYWAGRATLCGSPDDLRRHDQVFAAWFGLASTGPRPRRESAPTVTQAALDSGGGTGSGPLDEDALAVRASDADVLRHRDVAALSNAERARLARLFGALQPRAPRRRAHRATPARRGSVDARRTLREQLRRMGEPGAIAYRRRGSRARRIVLLIDVSGSMSAYADALLRLAHRFVVGSGAHVEVFTMGTRLTHITRALQHRDPEQALIACGDAVPDWSGGTRLAQNLDAFLRRWGRRGLARGAVVVVFSDGWERGDPADLGEQMRRLRAVAHRVVWVNPHRGKAGYEPVQGGIVAALPHCDEFVAGHSLAAFEQVVRVVADA
nr:VWA domain-containing protein [Kineosphaera limosa]